MKVTRVRRKNGRLCVAFEIRDSMRFDVCHVCRWDLCLLCLVWTLFRSVWPFSVAQVLGRVNHSFACLTAYLSLRSMQRALRGHKGGERALLTWRIYEENFEKSFRKISDFSDFEWFLMILWESGESEKMSHEISLRFPSMCRVRRKFFHRSDMVIYVGLPW